MQAVVDALRTQLVTFEVIAVSDGSTDGSPASIAGIEQVRVIELTDNQGKGAALRVGLAQGRGRYLGFIDGDGDIPARQLSHFLAAARAMTLMYSLAASSIRVQMSSTRRSGGCTPADTSS